VTRGGGEGRMGGGIERDLGEERGIIIKTIGKGGLEGGGIKGGEVNGEKRGEKERGNG